MITEKSAGAVVFRKEKGVIYYLLLHYVEGHWDFPKGNIEKGEELKETVVREIREETGIEDIEFLLEFKEIINYFYFRWDEKSKVRKKSDEKVSKTVTFFLAETKTKEIKISWEHRGFEWLPCSECLAKLTFKNGKDILIKANSFLLDGRI